jgi:hypothetical protein
MWLRGILARGPLTDQLWSIDTVRAPTGHPEN